MVQDVMTSSPGPIGSTKKNGGVVEVIVKSVSNGLSETLGRVSLGAGAQGAADVRPLTYLFDPELVPEIAKTGLPEGITVSYLSLAHFCDSCDTQVYLLRSGPVTLLDSELLMGADVASSLNYLFFHTRPKGSPTCTG